VTADMHSGVHLIGGDLVEVSPAYDPSGNTSLLGANLLFELLCLLSARRRSEAGG
jgi:guanidinobutyrase